MGALQNDVNLKLKALRTAQPKPGDTLYTVKSVAFTTMAGTRNLPEAQRLPEANKKLQQLENFSRSGDIQLLERMGFSTLDQALSFNDKLNGAPTAANFIRSMKRDLSGSQYNGFLSSLGAEVRKPGGVNIVNQLNNDLNQHPGWGARLKTAIRTHPTEMAGLMARYNANDRGGTQILEGALNQYAPAPQPAAALAEPPRRRNPAAGTGIRTFKDEVSEFKANPKVTDDEKAYFDREYERFRKSGNALTKAEVRKLREDMRRFKGADGSQLTPEERATLPANSPPPLATAGSTPPAIETPQGSAPPAGTPSAPQLSSFFKEDTIDIGNYGTMVIGLSTTLREKYPEMENEINTFEQGMMAKGPEFKAKYDSDPEFRAAFRQLAANLDGMGNSAAGGDLVRGKIRDIISQPTEKFLDTNYVKGLAEQTSMANGIGSFFGGIFNFIKSTFGNFFEGLGFTGPEVLNQLFAELGDIGKTLGGNISSIFSGERPIGSLMDGVTFGGNANGNLFGGLALGAANASGSPQASPMDVALGMNGAPAASTAPATPPPQAPNASDPNRTLAMGMTPPPLG